MRDVTKLSGVGPALAKTLQDHGLATIDAVLSAPLASLTTVPGIGTARAQRLKQAAETHSASDHPMQPGAGLAVAKRSAANPVPSAAATKATKPADRLQAPVKAGQQPSEEDLGAALAAAEAGRVAAEQKAAKAKAKAKKAARKAESLMADFAAAKEKARAKAKKMKADARRAIEQEKANAKAALAELERKAGDKPKEKDKDKKSKSGSNKSGSKSASKKKSKK